ncbi:hypothetical protein DV515_00007071 [Chloebia gouldiae]|uniref:Uncharacterized protein n=1 Tax=Chloebia gouldiae TaxID=44316 RepID=A0A3L8SIG0_CHLGU|nr:hypothetical protein DV515_00007071 [Chloebia gouldiae]
MSDPALSLGCVPKNGLAHSSPRPVPASSTMQQTKSRTDCIAMETIVGREDFSAGFAFMVQEAGPELAVLLSQLLPKPHGALEWLQHVPNSSDLPEPCLAAMSILDFCGTSSKVPRPWHSMNGAERNSSRQDPGDAKAWPEPSAPALFLTIFIISSASSVLQRDAIKLEVKHLTTLLSNDQQCVGAENIPNQNLDDQDPPAEKSLVLLPHLSSSREPEWNRWLGTTKHPGGCGGLRPWGALSAKVALVFLVDLVDPADQGIPGNLVLPLVLEVQGVPVGQKPSLATTPLICRGAQVSPEALVVQGALGILELLGHLEDQEYRSLEDLDPLSPLECLAALEKATHTYIAPSSTPNSKDALQQTRHAGQVSTDHGQEQSDTEKRVRKFYSKHTHKPSLLGNQVVQEVHPDQGDLEFLELRHLLNSTKRPTHLGYQEALDGQIHLGCPFHQVEGYCWDEQGEREAGREKDDMRLQNKSEVHNVVKLEVLVKQPET